MKTHNFSRTKCACEQCVGCCKRQPGPLIPGDLERIAALRGESVEEAKANFWASPGALVKHLSTGKVQRIGTITPRYRKGRCVFLDEHDRCSIHEAAPFGCAFFDTHMSNVTAQPRSVFAAQAAEDPEYQELRNSLPYAQHYKPSRYR
jgi:Fe-S-cluster containining protein